MTAKQLREELAKHPDDAEIFVADPNGNDYDLELSAAVAGWMSKQWNITTSELRAKRLKNPKRVVLLI